MQLGCNPALGTPYVLNSVAAVVGVDRYFQQSILGRMIIVSVTVTVVK